MKFILDTRPLKIIEFRRLWISSLISTLGAQITVITVPAQLWSLTEDSSMVGLAGLFGLVPLVIFGFWGGAIADSFDRRKVLLFSTSGLIVTAFLFFFQALFQLSNPWLILLIFALQQAFFAINSPARTAILPALVSTKLITAAHTLQITTFSASVIIGPLLGGALLPVLGFTWLYLFDAIAMFATLWAIIKLPALVPQGEVIKPSLKSILGGFSYTWAHKILLMSFLVDLIAMVFGMPRALYPQIANQNFQGPIDGGIEFALLSAAMGIGSLLGGLFSGWVARIERHGLATLISICIWGLAIIGFGVTVILAPQHTTLYLILAVCFLAIGGAADMISAAFRQTILQTAASDNVRGRLQGVFIVVVAGGPRFADMLHGWAAGLIGAGATVIAGGVLVIVGIIVSVLFVPSYARYRANASNAD